ncbi:MAG: ribosome maturation factor RimM [Lachnospiraceae bacterium]
MEDLLQVGIIASTHGIKGEVKVFPTTDDVSRFKKLKNVILKHKEENKELGIEGVKFFKKFVILKFVGLDSINDIETFKGDSLFVTRKNAVPLKKDEYFVADLIDLSIYNEENEEIGILKDVLVTGANDVYDISLHDGRQLLLPAIKECILSVDIEAKKMMIHILEGLL